MGGSTAPQPPLLPADLPVPEDDGAAGHLQGKEIPSLTFRSTLGRDLNLSELSATALVLYVFPGIGRPDRAPPAGWNETPGARGCTQQSCAFRDRQRELVDLGYSVAGLSAQQSEEQLEAAQRLNLAFPLLADPNRRLGDALRLPTFEIAGMTLYKRLTFVARARRIVKVFYPVFPPDENPGKVLEWIRADTHAG